MALKTSARKKTPSRKAPQSPKRKRGDARGSAGAGTVPAAESWSDVDRLIRRLARIDADAEALRADVDRRIKAAKDKAAAPAARLAGDRKAVEAEIETFAKAHRTDFGKDRSVRLVHGRVGWRAATRIRFTIKAAEVIARLKRRGLDLAIMVTERASKEILETFEDDVLAELGVKRKRSDKFYIELEEAHLGRP